ncbi:AAA family ATPase [Streptosporangium vulgare]|uniref:AAA family ATPase n=1 Tax=Streptosporangium vulgare TaxID=46190 RepID=UPI0031E25127
MLMDEVALVTSRRWQATDLPPEVTSFVGRRHEMAEVKRLLSGARVVTLTGPGGVGKTRLALHVAADVQRAFPDGVWFVELAGLETPELLAGLVNEALEIRDVSHRPAVEVLIDHLREKRALLILDNCEHLLRACAVLAGALVRSAPYLRILATSRQALGISGEQTLVVPPPAAAAGPRRPQAVRGAVGPVGVGTPVRRTGHRRTAGFHAHRGQPISGGADLPAAGRHPARDRAGRRAAARPLPRGAAGPAGQPVPAAHRRFTRDTAPPADTARADRLEPRPVHREGAVAVGARLGVRRRPGPRRGRGGLLGGTASTARRSSIW